MTHGRISYVQHTLAHHHLGRRMHRGRFVHALELALRWIDRGRQRRLLAELDDRMLADIGITREEALREAYRPFWRR